MRLFKALPLCSLLFCLQVAVLAQTPRRTPRRPAATKPAAPPPAPATTPAARPTPTPLPRRPIQLAIVNGQNISTSDLDPRVADALETFDQKLAETKQRLLNMQINTMLLEAEARRRNISTQQLYAQEITRKIQDPSEAEIKAITQENSEQLVGTEPAAARAQVVAFLRSEREETLSLEFIKRLRTTHSVVMGPDINTPNLAPSTVLVTVAGRPVLAGLMNERLKPIVYRLQLAAYEIQREALDETIGDILIIAEANRRGVPPETIVRTEITDKLRAPSDEEVTKFYTENKSRIPGDLSSVRLELANFLQEQERQRLESAFAERLRQGAKIQYLVAEPVPPVINVSADNDPARGPATAPVTIVKFTDFQCPSCAAMHPIIEEALKTYGNKVRLVVRDFPLSVHPNAFKAAEAANAAHAQGKFFEYTALLYQRQKALDLPSLKKYATELGLDRARFDQAVDRGAFADEVRADIQDGELYGVENTPTVFVNGVMLTRLSVEGLREAIDRALAAPTTKRPQ